MEHNDLPEFNKIQPFLRYARIYCRRLCCRRMCCRTPLSWLTSCRDLYKEGVPGQQELIGSLQLLYWVYYSNWTEVSKLLQSLLPYRDHPDMKHAIKVGRLQLRPQHHVARCLRTAACNVPSGMSDRFTRFRRQ